MDPNGITPTTPQSPSPVQAGPSPVVPLSLFQKYKKLIIAGALLLIIVIAGIAIFSLNRNDERVLTEAPSEMDKELAKVGSETIYKSDVWRAAREQYEGSGINDEVLNKFRDILIERAILDAEAKKLRITVTESEVQAVIGNSESVSLKESTYYDLIKSKIMASQTQNVEAFVIGFYIASFGDPQKPEYAVQRSDGSKALTEIETRMRAGESPLEITKSINEKYPSLKDILALNSFLYKYPTDEQNFLNPKLIQVKTIDPASPSYDPVYYSVVTSIKKGEVKKGERTTDGSGGFVMKAVEVKRDGFNTYEEFLSAKKQEYVSGVSTL